MPFVEGESLRDRLKRDRQLPLDDALRISTEIAEALAVAHASGVIHRDIKPENILLEKGHAILAEFGIARAVTAADTQKLTETGLAIGTPTYMSPEKSVGEGDLDARSDLYSLGCVLYEMLGDEGPAPRVRPDSGGRVGLSASYRRRIGPTPWSLPHATSNRSHRPAMMTRYTPSLLLLAACGRTPATPQDITFTATEFRFAGPDSIAPGVTRIRLVNRGTQAHHLILARLDDGKTLEDVQAALQKDPNGVPPFLSFRGGANMVGPGDSSASVNDLPAGHYLLFCFVPDPADGKPHFAKGMTRQIVAAGPRHEAPLPTADAEVRLNDFTFVTGELTAGTHTLHVVNDGPQVHEIQLVRLNEAATAQQFLAGMAPGAAGPPPGKFLGGPGALSTGEGNYWTVTLAPGKYLFLCFVPDAATGVPHFARGMVRELTVN